MKVRSLSRLIFRGVPPVLVLVFAAAAQEFVDEVSPLPRLVNEIAAVAEQSRKGLPLEHFEHWQRRSRAVAQLSKMGTNAWPAIPSLVNLAGHSDVQIAVGAATVLANIKAQEHPRWTEFQGGLPASTNGFRAFLYLVTGKTEFNRPYELTQRRFGLIALAAIGPPAKAAAQALIRLFQSKSEEDWKLWDSLAITLKAVGADGSGFVPSLQQIAEDAEEQVAVRVAAVQALASAGSNDQQTLSLLRRQMQDPHSHVRVAAGRALWKMKAPAGEILPTLIPLLNHKLASVRTATLLALAEIGEPARAARPAIEQLLGDESETVRHAAAEALQRISGGMQTPR